MGFHYDYNASGSPRWMKCFAFKALSRKAPPQRVNDAMVLGTATHYLGEWAMTHGYTNQVDDKLIGACIRIDRGGDAVAIVTGPGAIIGASYSGITWDENPTQTTPDHPRVIRVDESMVKAVAQYMAIVDGILTKYQGQAKRHVEMKFELTKDMGGMADLVIQAENRLIVLDYKNGYNAVNADGNSQLAMYGVGALAKFSGTCKINDVVMGIVQPNAPGPTLKTWTQTTEQMIEWRDRFEHARYQCVKVEQEYIAGKPIDQYCTTGSHCKWCRAMVVCPAMQKQTMALAQRSLNDLAPPATMPDPATLDDARLLWMAEHGESIIEYIGECKALMQDQAIETGKQWPGFKVVESVTKRRLIDKDGLAKAFKAKGLGEAFEPKLKALSKLEKVFGKDKMAPFVEKPMGSPVLVPITDGRPDHNATKLALLPALEKE